jgi:cytochrome c oxidase subunit 2
MKNIPNKLASMLCHAGVWAGAWVATAAHAVNDLPGGPAVNQLNLHPPVTQIAADQAWLHWFMLIVCTVIFIAVFAVMFYSIWKHRKSVGHKAASFHESVTVEIVWTVIPFIIVILMALPATKVIVAMKDTTNADLTIKATGMQWKWGYDYLKGEGEGIGFLSALDGEHRALSDAGGPKADAPIDNYLLKVDNPLVVPVDKKIRIITTANDVIHAFMVPSVRHQAGRDSRASCATPGSAPRRSATTTASAPSCAARNTPTCRSMSRWCRREDYSKWVGDEMKKIAAKRDDPSKVWTLDDLVARGEKVYTANCQACHQANGKGAGSIKPLDGAPVVLDADAGKQITVLLNGQNNGAMPAWKQLSDTEIAAVITYTKNHWSNKTGQLVQPAAVQSARQ